MKRSISLYIADKRVDLSDETFILFNYLREDLSNPTIVRNSFSQSITIKGTRNNNKVFGSIFHLDRQTLVSSERFDGVYFDPTRKTPFAIYASTGDVIESGYCKLESVNVEGSDVSYTITLYGGLGQFFYSLTTKENGDALTLADLQYRDASGDLTSNFGIRCDSRSVYDAWNYLKTGQVSLYSFWNVLNFCPAYNGLPSDFDTKHALVSSSMFDNVPYTMQKDGKTYGYKDGTDCCLAKFTNSHTEWEMGDLRWYLQRPVISVREFFNAICEPMNNPGGYEVVLDSTFFTEENHLYWDGWITLPTIATEDRTNEDCLVRCLQSTKTPADYLISFAKIFGLVFMCDTDRKVVTILTRASFYSKYAEDIPIDLTDRIDQESIEIIPTLTDSQWYQFGDQAEGEWNDNYLEEYGRAYGSQRVNTGYEFNADIQVVTDGIIFKDMTEVQESSILFTSQAIQPDGQGGWEEQFILPRYEDVSVELWASDEIASFNLECSLPSLFMDNPSYDYVDWLPKVQLHSADNKSLDGSDVLVVFEGMQEAPIYASSPRLTGKTYYITDDTEEMTDLLGSPCYDLTGSGEAVTSLPSFRRHHINGSFIVETFEYGEPLARPVLDLGHPQGDPMTIYARYWRDYLADRFDTDAKILSAKVDLSGLQVGQELLRHFFFYDGSLWVLNKISNHSLTTFDFSECEFIKVKDTTAYTIGTHTAETKYLNITPSSQSVSVVAEGGNALFTIASSSNWTISGSVSGMTLSRTSGNAGVTRVEVVVAPNGQSSVKVGTFTITNEEGITKTFTIVQAGASIVDTRTISFNATSASVTKAAQTFSVRITCSDSILASEIQPSSDVSWITGLSVSQVSDKVVEVTGNISANTEGERTARIGAQIVGTNIYTPTTYDITQAQGEVSAFSYSPVGVQVVSNIAQNQTIEIRATRNWTIGFYSAVTGATLSQTSGDAGVTFVTLYIPANTGTSSRSCVVQITHGTTKRYIEYEQNGRGTTSDSITASPLSVSLAAKNGSSVTTQVTATSAWSVNTAQTSSWLNVSASSYSAGTRTLTISAKSANYSQSARTGKVVLECGEATCTIQVTQANAYISASPSSPSLSSNGDNVSVNVTASDAWNIVSTSPSWITATKNGNTLVLSATKNTTGSERTGSVVIALTNDSSCSLTISVKQLTGGTQKEDSITAGQTSMSFNPSGEDKSLVIYATGAWTISYLPQWLTADKTSGTGSEAGEEIVLTAESNAGADRTDTIVFSLTGKGLTASVEVTQSLEARLTIQNPQETIDFQEQTLQVYILANCPWKLGVIAPFLSDPTYTEGTGNKLIEFHVSKNSGQYGRVGAIEFLYGDDYSRSAVASVDQGVAMLTISESYYTFDKDRETFDLEVVSNDDWEVISKPSWITLQTEGQRGTETIEVTADQNTTATERRGSIVFAVKGTMIQQVLEVNQASGSEILDVLTTSWNLDYQAQTIQVDIRSNTNWEIVDITPGLTFGQTSGYMDATNEFTIGQNYQDATKTFTAVIRTKSGGITKNLTIVQGVNHATIEVSVADLEFDILHQTRQFTIKSTKSWTLTSNSSDFTFRPTAGIADETYIIEASARIDATRTLVGTATITSGVDSESVNLVSRPESEPINRSI